MAGRSQQGTEEPGGVATRKVRSINFLGLPWLHRRRAGIAGAFLVLFSINSQKVKLELIRA